MERDASIWLPEDDRLTDPAQEDAPYGERPASLISPPPPPAAPRGEQIYIDAWDGYAREVGPARSAARQRSTLLMGRELIETLMLALVIFIAVRGVVQNFRVEGSSMDPTYRTGQYVLVNKGLFARVNLEAVGRVIPFIDSDDNSRYLFRGPRRGEVIVFHPPLPNSYDRDFIKRVIGLPGDHVQVKDGRVSVNGRELIETYLRNVQTFCGGQWCDLQLGPHEYFVMGDNRTNSSDSRLWGPVPAGNVIGKSMLVYLPLDDFGPAPNQAPLMAEASSVASDPPPLAPTPGVSGSPRP